MRRKGLPVKTALMLLLLAFLSLIQAKLAAEFVGLDEQFMGGLVPEASQSTKEDSDSEEFIPVLPNPLKRLQANYETNSLEAGVSVLVDCGCPGCCTLTPLTVTKTIELTSTNFCFFTATTATTTEITIVTTQTTTSVVTKTSNLKILETITKRTTSTLLSVFFTTSTVFNSILRFNTRVELATESTLVVSTTASFILGTVLRRIPYFTPYTIFNSTTSSYFTEYLQTFKISTLRTTITNYGGTVLGTFTTIQTNTERTSVDSVLSLITTIATVTQVNSLGQIGISATIEQPISSVVGQTLTIESTNTVPILYTATSVYGNFPQVITETATSLRTFSLLTSFPP